MEYIEHNGIAIQYPKSLNQMAREFAIEVNRVKADPELGIYVVKDTYYVHRLNGISQRYDLDDMVP